MARIKNVSGRAVTVPALGDRRVEKDQVIEVPDDLENAFTTTALWKAAAADKKKGSEG